ncbi:integral membrane protein [Histoplasma capsulatum G186AR]|uniref:Integral membrane protein n=1 Tax=Ajellomyces capsulatus (strain G186AR / H82 / ATCC MYA-2454 / RMSCC 2432) TaxID=447093 RepID=C0NG11_AJECG|nr:uncharacterized protein HCBG_01827 [Histoplasma capsulatum G186AR]EEH10182.1 integral membrane protein [Histoplasma capsulatum G186AR]
MGIGLLLEPLVVVALLLGGTWINRLSNVSCPYTSDTTRFSSVSSDDLTDKIMDNAEDKPSTTAGTDDGSLSTPTYRSSSPSLLLNQERPWRIRRIGLWLWKREIITPNTAKFRNRCFSRFLRRFPFLVECWYWTLVYWIYQIARAFTAVTLKDATVDVARKHAIQLLKLEKSFYILWEAHIQHYFLRRPILMAWTNRLYSFIHIPGTIAFLVLLYYYTNTNNYPESRHSVKCIGCPSRVPKVPELYQTRRRTLALCNLLAFVVFTLWLCMPPRLLSDRPVVGPVGELSRSYGFVDTVHGAGGASSVWTQNRFCNQYDSPPKPSAYHGSASPSILRILLLSPDLLYIYSTGYEIRTTVGFYSGYLAGFGRLSGIHMDTPSNPFLISEVDFHEPD